MPTTIKDANAAGLFSVIGNNGRLWTGKSARPTFPRVSAKAHDLRGASCPTSLSYDATWLAIDNRRFSDGFETGCCRR